MCSIHMGIDIGSTTAKVVLLNDDRELLFSKYRRHHTETQKTLRTILEELIDSFGNLEVDLLVTGSAGMGLSERLELPFVQEVIASTEVVRQLYPDVRTLIDIGGEDAKMVFFDHEGRPDIRMNGSCAGGTGAFLDEMANLLDVRVGELDELARRHTTIYPIASRCGVFAKTDLQNLLSRDIPRTDVAASVFHAVVLQTLTSLSRGQQTSPQILFSGGPLTFLPALRSAFQEVLELDVGDVLTVDNAQLLTAIGAALVGSHRRRRRRLDELLTQLSTSEEIDTQDQDRLPPLFRDENDFRQWESDHIEDRIQHVAVGKLNGDKLFLGVDSGSTTTKLVLIDAQGRVAFEHYDNNRGNAVESVRTGLEKLRGRFADERKPLTIARSVVTGYGEDLIRTAFNFDEGMIETLAHFRAARAFAADVTFLLDIGGQDMKAIFVKDGFIQNIAINEACSSGCGSFIESFARSMNYEVPDFARAACTAQAPCDLGTRCTVFMNSKVKQALREGAQINDISAGLAYSVVKNALHKVLKVTDTDQLGEQIVVQGGTFRNPAVHRALEELLGRPVICPDMAELMGAYGAALTARDEYMDGDDGQSHLADLDHLADATALKKRLIHCRGCENRCAVTKMVFANGNTFYSGNRCEKVFTNNGKESRKGTSLPDLKYKLLFDRATQPQSTPRFVIGIPRVLNVYEDFPFWNTLFVQCGIEVRLSSRSNSDLYKRGSAHVMSDNLCFPAKLVSGHVIDLIAADVDRIFLPMVFYAEAEFSDAANTFNCPVVSGYADVIRGVVDPQGKHGIPLDMPSVNLADKKLLTKTCVEYLTGLGVPAATVRRAVTAALEAQRVFKTQVRQLGTSVLENARAETRPVILLLGRPYHIDPLINHKIPEMLTGFGVDVITEDSVPLEQDQTLDNQHVVTQWAYVNRYYHAVRWAGQQDDVEVVQLNSFGCGPDPFVLEEVSTILGEYGKSPTVIRIDEIESTGSVRLRLRSMLEAMNRIESPLRRTVRPRKTIRTYQHEDRDRTLIVPDFSPFCSPPIVRPFQDLGYEIVTLPPADRRSVDVGLKYANNEICYPGIITIGDLVRALQSGKYDPSRTAIGFSQTGGQCRATSYVSMIKKALATAGLSQVPVVTLSTNLQVLNDQPGFEFDTKAYVYKAGIGIMFTDALSDLFHATAIREKVRGSARAMADRYLRSFMNGEVPIKKRALLDLLESAVDDFNALAVDNRSYPRAGIIGEIFVKYNGFANNYVADWLMDQGIEVVMPSFLEFFAGGLVQSQIAVKSHLRRRGMSWALSAAAERLMRRVWAEFDAVMQGSDFYRPHRDIREVARDAREVMSLDHQYGESWMIVGEIASLVYEDVNSVVCLQPFGCIANHIVAKGMQKQLKARYPELNLLMLDTDAGISEVNFFNRMHFFVDQALATHKARRGPGGHGPPERMDVLTAPEVHEAAGLCATEPVPLPAPSLPH